MYRVIQTGLLCSFLLLSAQVPVSNKDNVDPAIDQANHSIDLSMLDEDGLRILAQNLMRRVEALEQKVTTIPVDASEFAELQGKNRRLLAQIADLNAQNHDLQERLVTAMRLLNAKGDAAEPIPNPAGLADIAKYLYEYEWYLISSSGNGRMVVRSRDGGREVFRYNYEEYMNDRIGVDIFIRNDSDTPASFSMAIAAGGNIVGFTNKRREILARTTHRTPVIQPGEVYQFSKTMLVNDPEQVKVIELGNVKSVSE